MPMLISKQSLVSLAVVVLSAFAVTATIATPAEALSRRVAKIHSAVHVARHQKGDPYRWGAEGPHAFDCSGLVQFSYGRSGLDVPRTSRAQSRDVRRIRRRAMLPGDLMFFHKRNGRVYHVAIFTGWTNHHNRRMLHAPKPGRRVRTNLPWTSRWWPGTLRLRHRHHHR